MANFVAAAEHELGCAPRTEKDFRNVLAMREVDAITIATPGHWHTPMAILGLQAGKNVHMAGVISS